MTTTALDRAPMALTEDFEVYRDTALEWMSAQTEPFNADDLRKHIVPARPPWAGGVFRHASGERLIRIDQGSGWQPSSHKANKGTLRPKWVWAGPTTTEADCA